MNSPGEVGKVLASEASTQAPGRSFSRRTLMAGGVAATVGCVIGYTIFPVRADEPGTCVDPAELGGADASLRSAMDYTPKSADPEIRCSGCAFFTPSDDDARCGQCAILSGPVDGNGRCISWSPKA